MILIDMDIPKNCTGCYCTYDDFSGETRCVLGSPDIDWNERPCTCPMINADGLISKEEVLCYVSRLLNQEKRSDEMNCPKDLNSFLLSEPLFENTFPDNECEEKKFYGDCFHCFATSIRKRDKQLIDSVLDKIRAEIEEYKSRQLTLAVGVNDLEKGKQTALEYNLAIIDKYKAESEEV